MTLSHTWDLTPAQARRLQEQLRGRVTREDLLGGPPARVAGIDVGFEQNGAVTRAAAVVLSYPELEVVDTAIARQPTRFPYVPGLLSFRECPAALAALDAVVGQIMPTRIRRIIRSRLRLGWSHYFVFADRRRPADATAVG